MSKGQGRSLPTHPPCGLGNLELGLRQEGGDRVAPLQSPCPAPPPGESLNPGLALSRSQILPSHLANPGTPEPAQGLQTACEPVCMQVPGNGLGMDTQLGKRVPLSLPVPWLEVACDFILLPLVFPL